MSCRHDLALGSCQRCYPATGTVDPGPEEDHEPNMEGPGAVTLESWVRKAGQRKPGDGRIFQVSPASVGSNWYRDYVDGRAHVVALSPRITFVGETTPYPKDIVLMVWSGVRGGFSTWRWR